MRSVLLAAVAGLTLTTHVGCGSASPAGAAKVEPPRPRPAPVATPKKAEPPAPQPEPPPKKERPTFEADWKAAGTILAERRKGWEGRAEKAKRILTADELYNVELAISGAQHKPARMAEAEAAVLLRHGLADAARAISGEWAVSDADFRAISRAVWKPIDGAAAIADRAERWGQIREDRRELVARAVRTGATAADLSEDVRDAVIAAGLRSWLDR